MISIYTIGYTRPRRMKEYFPFHTMQEGGICVSKDGQPDKKEVQKQKSRGGPTITDETGKNSSRNAKKKDSVKRGGWQSDGHG